MQPGHAAQAVFQKGWALHQQGQLEDAARAYSQALKLYPRHFPALHLSGVIARDQGDSQRAVELIRRAIALNPNIAVAYANLGNALQDMGRLDEALANFDKALALQPALAEVHLNRGNVLSDLFRFEDASMAYAVALRLNPSLVAAHCYRGVARHSLGHFDEALACYEAALRLDPKNAGAWFNKAETQLLRGDFAKGWDSYEWRAVLTSRKVGYDQPLLSKPSDAKGRTVLVHAEQGLGDTLQAARYLPLLQQEGGRVLFAPQPQLVSLMRGLVGDIEIVKAEDASLQFDLHAPLMGLPRIFSSRIDTIPAAVPYLNAPSDHVERWRARIGNQGFRIGICWQGNPAYKPDAFRRSFPLRLFEGLSRMQGVRLISVHKGAGEIQLQSLPAGMVVETLGPDFAAGPDGFLDTAAVIAAMDLVITSDTVIPHLAGAMGVQTWLAAAQVPDWRWLLDRSDSPWYPSMRIFRQSRSGDWEGVFTQMQAALQALLR